MEETDITISLKDCFNIIKKNIIFIVVTVLVFSIGSFFISKYLIPKSYTSSALLYVETTYEEKDNYSSAQDLNAYNYAQKLVATYIRALDTNSFYSSVSDYLDNKYTPSQLRGMIKFVSDEETEIFQVNVVTHEPSESKKVADAVSEMAPNVIKNLKANATLKIVDAATVPTGPSSPNVSKNVLIAFAAALIITLLISFLREFLNTKIKYDEEATMLGKYPILSAIPDFEYYNDGKRSKRSNQKKH